jgi:hypothetical protein
MRVIQPTSRQIIILAVSIVLLFHGEASTQQLFIASPSHIIQFQVDEQLQPNTVSAKHQHSQVIIFQQLENFDDAVHTIQFVHASTLYADQDEQSSACTYFILHLRYTSSVGRQQVRW